MKITIGTSKFNNIVESYTGKKEEIKKAICNNTGIGFTSGSTQTIDLSKLSKEFLQYLLSSEELTERQRSSIYLWSGGSIDNSVVMSTPLDVHNFITALNRTNGGPNAEIFLCNKWYPIIIVSSMQKYMGHVFCVIRAEVEVCNTEVTLVNRTIGSDDFVESDGATKKTMNAVEFLTQLNLRPCQLDIKEFTARQNKAEIMNKRTGHVMSSNGTVLKLHRGAWGGETFINMELGSNDAPSKIVIDAECEASQRRYQFGTNDTNKISLPFVRAFSLAMKCWICIDVDDTYEYIWDDTAIQRLVLPDHMTKIITKLFNSMNENLFGDILKDKHGGMIILANGPSGVGKTLTAEVFAETTKRPLYVMEIAELGINVSKIEENLALVFNRVQRWNAVLLFDEADIFLAKRGESLERSVIVGIFLRLMDYYKGLLFLTSNRAEQIDEAFNSRITIKFEYPRLNAESRAKIWDIMLKRAGIECNDGLDGIPDININGRQIRNMVRLLKVLHGNKVTHENVKEICTYACK